MVTPRETKKDNVWKSFTKTCDQCSRADGCSAFQFASRIGFTMDYCVEFKEIIGL